MNIDELNVLNGVASEQNKQTCNTFIEDWRQKGLLQGYFDIKCNEILRRTRVRNTEILELYIYYCFITYEQTVRGYEENIFKQDLNYYYMLGQRQVGKEPREIPQKIFDKLMGTPSANGYTLDEYKGAKALNNTYQIHRLATQDIQQGKKPNVNHPAIKKQLEREQNERLKISQLFVKGLIALKISGAIDSVLIGLNNQAIVEGILEATGYKQEEGQKEPKVKFIAVIDDRTTPMCESLNGQIFNIVSENEFVRWSDSHKRMQKYKCKGLVLGLNLPPITNHFHYCRSTIEYLDNKEL